MSTTIAQATTQDDEDGYTYHIEREAATGYYRVIEYDARGNGWTVVASRLTLAEATRRRDRIASAARAVGARG